MVEQLNIKQQQWQALETRVRKYDPRQPIEEPIRKAIIALNLLGIKTHQCCGGHRDYRPLQGPFIAFIENNWKPYRATPSEIEAAKQAQPHEVARQVQRYLDEFYGESNVKRSKISCR